MRQGFQFGCKTLNCLDYPLNEDLEHRVRSCEALAVLFAQLAQIIIFLLENGLSGIPLLLVTEVLVCLVLRNVDCV